MTHYNTTHEQDKKLKEYEVKTETQEDKVLAFFQANSEKHFAPHQILESVFCSNVPPTSVRRAITNLTKSGKLYKTDVKVEGQFGRPCYTWMLA